ncbi:hypothetical protein SCI_0693 [Streptococcus constellatus subsp. pharyngis C1050]|uniref:Uncharacterized protein n=1 Tax=Streptococcus intermedius B196 TaxID=862967 RepID=T1ZDC4_STRIT|nr:hypothetical protein SCRE_0673 [Streptococcus constellatus subsp. pharyngis C232]AGU74279.1 hypothetical protein SCR2_0673 [Streptococcus constellatus subsp. pharyngis C818]AGU75890.1 hypothetical protein SIR_0518 [Streptococcus intermedius B196]AGU79647.1 hypothetical protein SCI_0693 [Streptococcus constellatus subsp. pharyngis C1050]
MVDIIPPNIKNRLSDSISGALTRGTIRFHLVFQTLILNPFASEFT